MSRSKPTGGRVLGLVLFPEILNSVRVDRNRRDALNSAIDDRGDDEIAGVELAVSHGGGRVADDGRTLVAHQDIFDFGMESDAADVAGSTDAADVGANAGMSDKASVASANALIGSVDSATVNQAIGDVQRVTGAVSGKTEQIQSIIERHAMDSTFVLHIPSPG